MDSSTIITTGVSRAIQDTVERDINLLLKAHPDYVKPGNDKQVPGEFFVGEYDYCAPYLWSVYASLLLTRVWNAQCLFTPRALKYCRLKFGLDQPTVMAGKNRLDVFRAVLRARIPNPVLAPPARSDEHCATCANQSDCEQRYLQRVEVEVLDLLTLRDRDEVRQLKAVINRLIDDKEGASQIVEPSEIEREFRGVVQDLNKRMRLVFPRVKRWANITALLSVPFSIAGLLSGSSAMTWAGAGLIGASQVAKELIELHSSKHRWLSFFTEPGVSPQTAGRFRTGPQGRHNERADSA